MRPALVTSIVATLAVLAVAAPQPARQGICDSIPIAKHSRLVNDDKTVNFDALNSHVASVKAKVQRGLNNFEKNTGSKHPSAMVGKRKDGHGDGDALIDDQSELWYGTISVGTPAKSFTVDFDIGSSDFFLPASICGSSCRGHTLWNPASSSTSTDLGQTFILLYGDGSFLSGEQYTDTVSIARFTATTQTLGAASVYSSGFEISHFPPDGLMGMGFESISDYPADPVFQTLVDQGKVTDPVFSFKLSSSAAELYIGGSNSALYTGNFTYTPVTQQGYWQVNMENVRAEGKTILSSVDVIIDTGTTLIFGSPSQVSKLYSTIGGKVISADRGFYSFPCSSFPHISFTFGGTSFPISTSALNLGQVSPGSSECVSGLIGEDVGACECLHPLVPGLIADGIC